MIPDSEAARLPVSTAEDLRARLRDTHYTTCNTLNTIFTGGLVVYLLRRVLEMPAAQRPWVLVLATLRVWLQSASVVSLLGGLRTLNMLSGARSDAFNAHVPGLVETDMRRSAWARLTLAPLALALAYSPLSAQVLAAFALTCSATALVIDELVWARTVAHGRG
ncbi:hypothetical protein BH11PSE9_BH11PSE9_14120 [soil metagenome]